MYIIYDARHFEDYYSGLSRYSFSVLKEIIIKGEFEKLEIIFNTNYDYSKNPLFIQLENLPASKNIKHIFLNANIFSFKQHYQISKYVNNSNCDKYFYPHFDSPLLVKKKVVFVIHDLFPLVLDSYVLKHGFLKKLYFKMIIRINLLKKNTQCIAVSKTTKNDILTFFGNKFSKKIKVIYEDSFSDVEVKNESFSQFSELINKKFLFYIGGRRRHKNLKQMIDIFNTLVENKLYNGYLVIAGSKKNFYFDLDDYIHNKNNIFVFGKVTDSELSYLYSKMDSLMFLSKYEGFGLPIIEAAKHNKKIITTSLGACGEIAPENSLKLDINIDNSQLGLTISEYLEKDIKIDNRFFLKDYSWSNTAAFILEARAG